MQITITLLPPFRRSGESGQISLSLPGEPVNARELAEHLVRIKPDALAFDPIDRHGMLTAEFLVNGRHVPAGYRFMDGDQVTLIPYICGG